MIPVVTLDKEGNINGQQAFNDNLTLQEQINRAMLAVIFTAQQKLTNDKNDLDKIIMSGKYTDTELTTINTAVNTLKTAVDSAIKTFETSLAQL